MSDYDVIIIGAGHAGIEAALACARMGSAVLVANLRPDTAGAMSCNPAIGGVGKGQLVKEIDALGGQMGIAADACGIQFRKLNASKGPAVQSSRAQIDMYRYKEYMQSVLKEQDNLTIKEAEVEGLIVKDNSVCGVITDKGRKITSKCVIIAAGTFLDGLIHVGLKNFPGGRISEPASCCLTANLKELGFCLLRFKTGTCARLDKNTIDFSKLKIQRGDEHPCAFSLLTEHFSPEQVPCYIAYTNKETHRIIMDNLDKSPLYQGVIQATGVRYCPSIEDKIVKFSDRQRHQVFLEPEGMDTDRIYPNGLSTSLPEEVQLEFLRSIDGLKEVKVFCYGYGIEHTVIDPTQLYPTLEAKRIENLFFAGQINGTTGYEEAAAQGLIAGINAVLKLRGKSPFILERSGSYIGVLIDDLVTKGTNEPYRMFTSRVERRLILREDNADLRLREQGYQMGLVSREEYQKTESKKENIKKGISFLQTRYIRPSEEINKFLVRLKTSPLKKTVTLEELLKRPQINWEELREIFSIDNGGARDNILFDPANSVAQQVEIEVKYSGFIDRQLKEVEKFKNLEKIKLPSDMDYTRLSALSREIREKLTRIRPVTLGQASRISGITPVAISLLMVYLKKMNKYPHH